MRLFLFILLNLSLAQQAGAHGTLRDAGDWEERLIIFPDTAEYRTLVVDLHTHSAFSDGHVWPQIRVSEANRDGLDAMAVTEHLEWQPHLGDIPHPDRNRSYEIARKAATGLDLMIIPGVEITREAPAGHMNAIFVTDANELLGPESPPPVAEESEPRLAYYRHAGEWPAQAAVEAANRQGAFVFRNHPDWTRQQKNGIAVVNDFHRKNAQQGLLHGIEVANGSNYSQEAFAIALEQDLTIIGVSDIHDLIDWDYPPHKGEHRPVTLVFARERSAEAIKEALFAKRSLVWFENLLVGRDDMMTPLLQASLSADAMGYLPDTDVLVVKFVNLSDARFILANRSEFTFMQAADLLEIPPHGELMLSVKPGERIDSIALEFEVLNALTAPARPAVMTFNLPVGSEDFSL